MFSFSCCLELFPGGGLKTLFLRRSGDGLRGNLPDEGPGRRYHDVSEQKIAGP